MCGPAVSLCLVKGGIRSGVMHLMPKNNMAVLVRSEESACQANLLAYNRVINNYSSMLRVELNHRDVWQLRIRNLWHLYNRRIRNLRHLCNRVIGHQWQGQDAQGGGGGRYESLYDRFLSGLMCEIARVAARGRNGLGAAGVWSPGAWRGLAVCAAPQLPVATGVWSGGAQTS